MKTYLLRDPQTVEPQKRPLTPPMNRKAGRVPPCAPSANLSSSGAQVTRPTATSAAGPALFVGLDVHNDSIAVSLAPSDRTEVRRYGIIGGTHDDVLKLVKKLSAAHPGVALQFCYEAGPRG